MQPNNGRCRGGDKVGPSGVMAASWQLQARGPCVMSDITNIQAS